MLLLGFDTTIIIAGLWTVKHLTLCYVNSFSLKTCWHHGHKPGSESELRWNILINLIGHSKGFEINAKSNQKPSVGCPFGLVKFKTRHHFLDYL